MPTEYTLTGENHLRLEKAFENVQRVDISIDCVLEGQMGRAVVDDPENPSVFMIQVGPFHYFAGDAGSEESRIMLKAIPPYSLLMPSGPQWFEKAREIHGDRLISFPRYSYSPDKLSLGRLDEILNSSQFRETIERIDMVTAGVTPDDMPDFVDLSDFKSGEDFCNRGIGFCLRDDGKLVGAAFSSLVCSTGIEVSIFVMPEHRMKGAATALACNLLKYCLEHNLRPNWDAANPESCRLAEKLGYEPTGTYDALVLMPGS